MTYRLPPSISARAMAARLGIPYTTMTDILRGVHVPSPMVVARMWEVTGEPPPWVEASAGGAIAVMRLPAGMASVMVPGRVIATGPVDRVLALRHHGRVISHTIYGRPAPEPEAAPVRAVDPALADLRRRREDLW